MLTLDLKQEIFLKVGLKRLKKCDVGLGRKPNNWQHRTDGQIAPHTCRRSAILFLCVELPEIVVFTLSIQLRILSNYAYRK